MMDITQFQNRVFEKLDKLDDRAKETCERLSKLEQKVEDNIDKKIKSSEKKYQVITAVLGIITTVSTVVAVLK